MIRPRNPNDAMIRQMMYKAGYASGANTIGRLVLPPPPRGSSQRARLERRVRLSTGAVLELPDGMHPLIFAISTEEQRVELLVQHMKIEPLAPGERMIDLPRPYVQRDIVPAPEGHVVITTITQRAPNAPTLPRPD